VRNGRGIGGLLGVEKTTVEHVEFDEDEQLLVAHVPGLAPRTWPGATPGGDAQKHGPLGAGTIFTFAPGQRWGNSSSVDARRTPMLINARIPRNTGLQRFSTPTTR
jgi:hypothetical protein